METAAARAVSRLTALGANSCLTSPRSARSASYAASVTNGRRNLPPRPRNSPAKRAVTANDAPSDSVVGPTTFVADPKPCPRLYRLARSAIDS